MTLMTAAASTTRDLILQDAADYRASVAKGGNGSEGFTTTDGTGPVYVTPASKYGWHVTSHSDAMYTLTTHGTWEYDERIDNAARYWPALDAAVEALLAITR
ncbi:hypothetical protein [Nonomuraea sp. NPDC049400]|uniref:hypothetical protein n=1 Tax=Nonomuraea sp. NPDC049400 TaxID=3364352 RepID=UPI0037BCBE86